MNLYMIASGCVFFVRSHSFILYVLCSANLNYIKAVGTAFELGGGGVQKKCAANFLYHTYISKGYNFLH